MNDFLTKMPDLIPDYIDLLWLPVGWFAAHRHQRVLVMAFIITCLLTFRIQVELMESTGYDSGFLPFLDSNVFTRGVIVYSVIFLLYLILAHYSPRSKKIIFFAASLSIYVMAFCISMLIMVL
jgi:hypothetical protein